MNENKNVVVQNESFNIDSELTILDQACAKLLQTPHYKQIGYNTIFAILRVAKNLNIDPFLALEGGLYYTKGKVEMKAQLMNSLIRKAKHSITKDKKSDDTICILHGKRADTGDTWTESFSVKDAERAGLFKNNVWGSYTRDMIFNRALSRLARQLFPDVIGSCYVEGEIKDDPNIPDSTNKQIETIDLVQSLTDKNPVKEEVITYDQCQFLYNLLQQCPKYYQKVSEFFYKKGITGLDSIPASTYDRIVQGAHKAIEELNKATEEQLEEKEPEEMIEVADE